MNEIQKSLLVMLKSQQLAYLSQLELIEALSEERASALAPDTLPPEFIRPGRVVDAEYNGVEDRPQKGGGGRRLLRDKPGLPHIDIAAEVYAQEHKRFKPRDLQKALKQQGYRVPHYSFRRALVRLRNAGKLRLHGRSASAEYEWLESPQVSAGAAQNNAERSDLTRPVDLFPGIKLSSAEQAMVEFAQRNGGSFTYQELEAGAKNDVRFPEGFFPNGKHASLHTAKKKGLFQAVHPEGDPKKPRFVLSQPKLNNAKPTRKDELTQRVLGIVRGLGGDKVAVADIRNEYIKRFGTPFERAEYQTLYDPVFQKIDAATFSLAEQAKASSA